MSASMKTETIGGRSGADQVLNQNEHGATSAILAVTRGPAFTIAQRGFEFRSRHGVEQPLCVCASHDLDRTEAAAILDEVCRRDGRGSTAGSIRHAAGSIALSSVLAAASDGIAERVLVTIEDKRAALARIAAERIFVPILDPACGRASPGVAALERALLDAMVTSETEVTTLTFIVDHMAATGSLGYPPDLFADRSGVGEAFAPVQTFLDEHIGAIAARRSISDAFDASPADSRLAWRMLRDGLSAHARRWSSCAAVFARPEPMTVLASSRDRDVGLQQDTGRYLGLGEDADDPAKAVIADVDDSRATLAVLVASSALSEAGVKLWPCRADRVHA